MSPTLQEGVRLSTICEKEGWVWGVAGRAGHDEVAVGGEGGFIEVLKLKVQDITAIYEVCVMSSVPLGSAESHRGLFFSNDARRIRDVQNKIIYRSFLRADGMCVDRILCP